MDCRRRAWGEKGGPLPADVRAAWAGSGQTNQNGTVLDVGRDDISDLDDDGDDGEDTSLRWV